MRALSGSLFVKQGDVLLYLGVTRITFDGQRVEGLALRLEQPHPYAAGADPLLDAVIDLLVK
jgi:hypothetical protein